MVIMPAIFNSALTLCQTLVKYSASDCIFAVALGARCRYHSHFRLKKLGAGSRVTEPAGARAVPETLMGVDFRVCRLSPDVCLAPRAASEFFLHKIKKADDLS